MEDFVERCDNCRWHRDVPEEFQEKVKEQEDELAKKIADEKYHWQYDKLYEALYGTVFTLCIKKNHFARTKFCCGDWEAPVSYSD